MFVVVDATLGKGIKLPFSPPERAHSSGDLLVEFKAKGLEQEAVRKVDLEVRDWRTDSVLWTHHYQHERPAVTTISQEKEMILTWGLETDGARDEMKDHPELKSQADALPRKKQGFLVEVVDKRTGIYQHGLVVDVRDRTGGWLDQREAVAFGDYALIGSEHESTAIYRMSSGTRVGEVFGEAVAVDAATGMFCVTNRRNELVVYESASAREREHVTYAAPVRFAQFLPERGQILILTADQKVHIISAGDR